MQRFDLNAGKEYSKSELEEIFETNFGARIKGITLRRDRNNDPYTIIFSRADGPYSDRVHGNSFYYDGEGRDKDQELTVANKSLIEANKTGRIIYGFRQDEAGANWRYLGILQVVDYSYIVKNGFKTYEFQLTAEPIDSDSLLEAQESIKSAVHIEPVLIDEVGTKTVKVRARKAAFGKLVKANYDNACAICGRRRFTIAGYPEVEAAHIYPKEKLGADDPRNGISLCRLHHWAFDSGLLAINDDYTILIKPQIIDQSDYAEITAYKGLVIGLPADNTMRPHSIYLSEHRILHGF